MRLCEFVFLSVLTYTCVCLCTLYVHLILADRNRCEVILKCIIKHMHT